MNEMELLSSLDNKLIIAQIQEKGSVNCFMLSNNPPAGEDLSNMKYKNEKN